MSEKQWYEDIPRDEIRDKHVRVTCEEGAIFEGRLKPDGPYAALGFKPFVGLKGRSSAYFEGFHVLERGSDDSWHPLIGITSVDLVWDERDWDWIDAKDLRCGDAVVANGVLYKVRAMGLQDEHPFVLADAPGRLSIDLRLVSCALRRRVQVPVKPGFYQDTLGEFWARSAKPTDDGPWRSVEPDALDQPAKSDKYMANLMPLTPVHFVDGRAPEPGDELASVMRVTSKGVTFTTEAA